MKPTCLLYLLLLTPILGHASEKPGRYRWRISNQNGYPIYSDVRYLKSNFIGAPDWQRNERFGRILATNLLIPQISISREDKITNWIWAAETRIAPAIDFWQTGGKYPKPFYRDEFTLNFIVGKLIQGTHFNQRFYCGLSERYLITERILTADQDAFFGPDQFNFNTGVVLKYEITTGLGKNKRWELGLGVSQMLYTSKINVFSGGLLISRYFGKFKESFATDEEESRSSE
ncbi:MAG: hypothetical protein GC181_07070 [Bacteroidetes bacterium]|nr:hypothetical protein [Bacteroidota bacterium]